MSDKTGIEWTDATWNPLRGCSRVSEGCRHCYAETVAGRFSGPGMPYEGLVTKTTQGPTWNGTVKLMPEDILSQPLRWQKPRMIFVNSMSDLFHEAVPDEFIADVFRTMAWGHQHTFQVLTKRPERMVRLLSNYEFQDSVTDNAHECADWQWPLKNVWLGVSVEDQATADERIPLLLLTPAATRWVSAEPLLGPVDLRRFLEFYVGSSNETAFGLDWVVVGGESGPKARPMHPDWARNLRDQCASAGVPFLFKQWGEWKPVTEKREITNAPIFVKRDPLDTRICNSGTFHLGHQTWACVEDPSYDWRYPVIKVGKKAAGRLLDGVQHDAYPVMLR